MGIAISLLIVFVVAPLMITHKTMGGAGVLFFVALFGGVAVVAKLADEQPDIGIPLLLVAAVALIVWEIYLLCHKNKIVEDHAKMIIEQAKERKEEADRLWAEDPRYRKTREKYEKLMSKGKQ